MREEEMEFFGELIGEGSGLDTVNRCYVWRILWSHVQSGDIKIINFVRLLT